MTTHMYVDPPGHYQVTLPHRKDLPPLGTSRPQAVQRFLAMSNERDHGQPFSPLSKSTLTLGMQSLCLLTPSTLPLNNITCPCMVTKESSTITKLRVVFDASAKTSTSLSLNDTLLTGPTLYLNLDTILLRFRLHLIVVTADIGKMYRAVYLAPQDRDFHRLLWREEPTGPLLDFRMTRVTFGVSSSPYLAIRVLQQTAADFGHLYPMASPHVYRSFYVDDHLAGADTPEQALQLHKDVRALLLKGGFDLRKWRSSSPVTLASIEESLLERCQFKS